MNKEQYLYIATCRCVTSCVSNTSRRVSQKKVYVAQKMLHKSISQSQDPPANDDMYISYNYSVSIRPSCIRSRERSHDELRAPTRQEVDVLESEIVMSLLCNCTYSSPLPPQTPCSTLVLVAFVAPVGVLAAVAVVLRLFRVGVATFGDKSCTTGQLDITDESINPCA